MQTIGSAPPLSVRAREQLASLAGDFEQGNARIRVITRIRNTLNAELAVVAPQHDTEEQKAAVLRARADAGYESAERMLNSTAVLRSTLSKKVAGLRQRIDALDVEEASIRIWLSPTGRMLDGIFAHTGVGEIRHLLPDFGSYVIEVGGLA